MYMNELFLDISEGTLFMDLLEVQFLILPSPLPLAHVPALNFNKVMVVWGLWV